RLRLSEAGRSSLRMATSQGRGPWGRQTSRPRKPQRTRGTTVVSESTGLVQPLGRVQGPQMTRKKVVFLPSWYPGPEAPVSGISIKDQVECLSAGHEVTVLVPCLVGWREALRGDGPPPLTVRPGLHRSEEW